MQSEGRQVHGEETLDINTTGTFLYARATARQTDDRTGVRRRGNMMFVASYSGHRVNSPQPQIAYHVSEAALLMLEGCSAAEWARYGIRVNSIPPGQMETILNEGDGMAEGRAMWADAPPTGRMRSPSE
ncbi:hypothetical protein B2J93_2082 [Marssonina coronariae]|uniref:Uncharacterized protein n=1 Tax=Diplocarpon coronariae TaxID=2795749 RepID=A0A218Z8P4_9HELO|nr:hypothetical protein B2J93_2082 [Marssonina coronariae]